MECPQAQLCSNSIILLSSLYEQRHGKAEPCFHGRKVFCCFTVIIEMITNGMIQCLFLHSTKYLSTYYKMESPSYSSRSLENYSCYSAYSIISNWEFSLREVSADSLKLLSSSLILMGSSLLRKDIISLAYVMWLFCLESWALMLMFLFIRSSSFYISSR